MKLNKQALWVANCAAALVLVVAMAASASDIGETINAACTSCHSAKRTCLNLGIKDQAGWTATLKAMVDKGAQLAPARIDEAAAYLTGLKPGDGPVCQ